LDDDEVYNTNPQANYGAPNYNQNQNPYGQQQQYSGAQYGQTQNVNPLYGQQQQYGQQ
ncbi:hypothetical protein ANCDUO_26202, partial [Ancylostoma duodenale]